MRSPFWLLFYLSGIIALSGCDHWNTAEKANKSAFISGREDILLRIAHSTEAGGDIAGAEKQYKQAISTSGESVQPRIELAEFYQRQHRTAEAIDILTGILQLQPYNVDIMRALANAYINSGSPEKAVTLLNKAIATDNKNALIYNSKGVALDALEQYSEAQKSYKTALTLNPDDAITFKTNLSMSYILSGSYDAAIELLLPLLSKPEVTPTIRQNLAMAYGMKGESDKALKLGLKDLTAKQAEENLKFYHMFNGKTFLGNRHPTTASTTSIEELFPDQVTEEKKPGAEQKEKLIPVSLKESLPVRKQESVIATSSKPVFPIPALKPDK